MIEELITEATVTMMAMITMMLIITIMAMMTGKRVQKGCCGVWVL